MNSRPIRNSVSAKQSIELNCSMTHRHHIHPISLNGERKGKIIILTLREHFIAHLILWKAFGGKMAQAFFYMQHKNSTSLTDCSLTSRQYEILSLENSLYRSTLPSPMKGKKHTESSIEKNRASKRGLGLGHITLTKNCKNCRVHPDRVESLIEEGWEVGFYVESLTGPKPNTWCWVKSESESKMIRITETNDFLKQNPDWTLGKFISDEHLEAIQKAVAARVYTDEIRKRIGDANRNRPPASQETRDKISASNTGKVRSEETRQKYRDRMTGSSMPRVSLDKMIQTKLDQKKRWVHLPGQTAWEAIQVHEWELEKYYQDGYIAGRGKMVGVKNSGTPKGGRWVTKDGVSNQVPAGELESFISNGYKLGRAGSFEISSERIFRPVGYKWVHDPISGDAKQCKPEDAAHLIEQGWQPGRGKNKNPGKPRPKAQGSVWITNGIENRTVHLDVIQEFIDEGWAKGRGTSPLKGIKKE